MNENWPRIKTLAVKMECEDLAIGTDVKMYGEMRDKGNSPHFVFLTSDAHLMISGTYRTALLQKNVSFP